jgi:hypothetical protein
VGAPLLYYPLAWLARLGLCVLLPVPGATPGLLPPPVPAKSQRKRSPAPQACEGLTQQPYGGLGKPETGEPHPPPPLRPAPMPLTKRRPRTVEPSRPGWPSSTGDSRGWRGRNHRRAQGPPPGGPWRPGHGTACDGSWPDPPGPILPGQPAAAALLVRGRACGAAGLGRRATARGLEGAAHPG